MSNQTAYVLSVDYGVNKYVLRQAYSNQDDAAEELLRQVKLDMRNNPERTLSYIELDSSNLLPYTYTITKVTIDGDEDEPDND